MKSISILTFTFTIFTLTALSQSQKKAINKSGTEPAFFIDSASISKNDLEKYDPKDIAAINVYKGKEAAALLGEEGKDGAVFIETKLFIKKKYWIYFSSRSREYAAAVPNAAGDTVVQYILNGNVLRDNFAGDLAPIDDKVLESIIVLSREELQKQYGITDKRYGVVIRSKTPDKLH